MSEDRRCFEKHPHPAYGPCDAFGGNGEWCSCCADARWRAEDERDEARRRRDEWRAKAEEVEVLRKALREKVGAPWPPNLSRAPWAGLAADEKRRADDAEAERDALRAEVERLRAEVAIWRRNFRRPDGPLDEVCEGACVYERRWIGCDRGCNPVWRTDAYLWARLTEIYAEIDGPALNQSPAEVNQDAGKRQ